MLPDEVRMAVQNLATAPSLGRLEALHEPGGLLRGAVEDLVDAAELGAGRALRSRSNEGWASWETIGRALGVSHTQAIRRFGDCL